MGTGEHLMRLKFKGNANPSVEDVKKEEFNFQAGLSTFNKEEVLAKVAQESASDAKNKYVKDDFFDSLSCDVLDREDGRRTRLNAHEERALNQDTFGAIALQSNYRRNYRGGGGRGEGGRGRGRGGRGRGGGGRGRGRSAPSTTATA